MKRKIFYLVSGILFLLAAGLQYNDPDPWGWIFIYGATGLVCILASRQMYFRIQTLVLLLVSLVWMFFLIPGFFEWLSSGDLGSLVDDMDPNRGYIEVAREFLGLFILLLVLLSVYLQARKGPESK